MGRGGWSRGSEKVWIRCWSEIDRGDQSIQTWTFVLISDCSSTRSRMSTVPSGVANQDNGGVFESISSDQRVVEAESVASRVPQQANPSCYLPTRKLWFKTARLLRISDFFRDFKQARLDLLTPSNCINGHQNSCCYRWCWKRDWKGFGICFCPAAFRRSARS